MASKKKISPDIARLVAARRKKEDELLVAVSAATRVRDDAVTERDTQAERLEKAVATAEGALGAARQLVVDEFGKAATARLLGISVRELTASLRLAPGEDDKPVTDKPAVLDVPAAPVTIGEPANVPAGAFGAAG